jgi:hypothetical protein
VCTPKDLGGIGTISYWHMNVALMLKWVWRIITDDRGLWLKLVKAKYLRGQPLLACEPREGSPFWRSLHNIKHIIRARLSLSMGDDRGTMFWLDPWLSGRPIRQDFSKLYAICADPSILVAESAQRDWAIQFCRGLAQGKAMSLEWLRNLLLKGPRGGVDSPS